MPGSRTKLWVSRVKTESTHPPSGLFTKKAPAHGAGSDFYRRSLRRRQPWEPTVSRAVNRPDAATNPASRSRGMPGSFQETEMLCQRTLDRRHRRPLFCGADPLLSVRYRTVEELLGLLFSPRHFREYHFYLTMGGEQMGSPEEKDKPSTTLPGTVEKIIKPIDPSEPEKAQITIEGAEDLYREIRVKNTLKDEKGEEVTINEGASVDVTIEADEKDTIKKEK